VKHSRWELGRIGIAWSDVGGIAGTGRTVVAAKAYWDRVRGEDKTTIAVRDGSGLQTAQSFDLLGNG
jgi:hypothetical protein